MGSVKFDDVVDRDVTIADVLINMFDLFHFSSKYHLCTSARDVSAPTLYSYVLTWESQILNSTTFKF